MKNRTLQKHELQILVFRRGRKKEKKKDSFDTRKRTQKTSMNSSKYSYENEEHNSYGNPMKFSQPSSEIVINTQTCKIIETCKIIDTVTNKLSITLVDKNAKKSCIIKRYELMNCTCHI